MTVKMDLDDVPVLRAHIENHAVLRADEVLDHPQMRENDYVVEVDDPRIGKVKMTGIPLRLSNNPGSIRRLAPNLGEHTDEVMKELGYSKREIEELRKSRVIL